MKVIWTSFALENLKQIFFYYKEAASPEIATKIKRRILQRTKQLSKFPESGTLEPILIDFGKNHRYLVSGNYKIIYYFDKNFVYVTDIFDTRQDPKRIERTKL